MKLSWIAQPSVLKEIRTRKKSEFSIKIASFPHTFIHTKNRVIFHHTRKNRVISHERFLECIYEIKYPNSFDLENNFYNTHFI